MNLRKVTGDIVETANKENLAHENACCPFCGCKDIWVTVETIISCIQQKCPVYTDGVDYSDDKPLVGNTLGEMISSQFGEVKSCNRYLLMFNCDGCGKKWDAEFGEYKWVKIDNGLYSFVKNDKAGGKEKRGRRKNDCW